MTDSCSLLVCRGFVMLQKGRNERERERGKLLMKAGNQLQVQLAVAGR